MFLMIEIQPDIAFAIFVVSKFAKNPSYQHTEVVKTIFKYLKESQDQGITYDEEKELRIKGYSDSDYAGDKESPKLTSGYIFMLNGRPMS